MSKEIILPADEQYMPAVELHAGDIRALYEEGRLRYLSAGNMELVRMIYPALRDENWTTIIPVINEDRISRQPHSFSISYSALYEAGDIRYKAFYRIEGRADNTITFSMKGEALGSFKKRRIGLCLLHPIETCSGREIELMQPDDTTYSSSFPEFVSPFQPFLNITGMKWLTENNTVVEIKFEGDIFETEDQRNWSDNSYKTYGTPLSVPAPAMVNKGDTVEQRITLRADTSNANNKKTVPKEEKKNKFPLIGYAKGNGRQPLTTAQAALLAQIPFDHYQVQLDIQEDWKPVWKTAVDEARQLNTSIELFLNFNKLTDEEIDIVIKEMHPSRHLLSSVLILAAKRETAPLDFFEKAYRAIKQHLGDVKTGYGTNGNFADLNRNRPSETAYDFVNFHLEPQVHTVDSRSIMDNLGSHQTLILSTNKFTDGRPVHVSPVNFSSADTADRRFPTAFAAWWTLQALRDLSAAESVTFHELTGNEGIVNGEQTTPLFKVLKTIRDFSPDYILQNTGDKVIFQKKDGERLVFSSKLARPDWMK